MAETPDFIPDAQMPQAQPTSQTDQGIKTPGSTPDFIPENEFQSDEERYGSTGQQAITALEGAGRGLLSAPVSNVIEQGLGVSPQSILARQKTNPISSGLGEAAGLVGGIATDTGAASLLSEIGEGAKGIAGLSEAAEGASLTHKIGSSAVQQAAEMAVLTGSDEVGKMLLNDPDTSAESAIINTGLGAVLGGATGAAVTGVVSPLWKATAGPKVEQLLNTVAKRWNGESIIKPPDEIINDLKTLGIHDTTTPLQAADLSESPTANEWSKNLIRSENPKYLAERQALKENVANSVVEPLGSSIEDMRAYDEADGGKSVKDAINGQIKETFEPLWEAMDKRKAEASTLSTSDNDKLKLMDQLREKGVTSYAPNSPHSDIFYKAGERQLDFGSLADYDKYDTELRNDATKAFRAGDNESGLAYKQVRDMIRDFKDKIIMNSAAESEGIPNASKEAAAWIAERKALNQKYAEAEGIREQLSDHFNIRSNNSRDFMRQLDQNMTPEQVFKKFGIKNNTEGAEFLQKNFPEAFNEVIKNERRSLLKPAINAAKDDMPIDVNKLNKIIEKTKAGKDTYLNTILPPEFIQRAEAGARVLEQMTNPKDSGTPAGIWNMVKHLGTSAMGAIGMMSGHGIGSSLLLGELATRLGKEAPEAAKLAMLRFAASSEPISAPGLKAAIDFIDQTYKGQNMLSRAVKNTLKPGAMVIAAHNMPAQADRDKLDKAMAKAEKSPQQFAQSQSGDLGHYLPPHQQSVTQASTRAMQYLQGLKPKPQMQGPLDKSIPPSQADITRYKNAQDIALNPMLVLNKIKNGTLQVNDMHDLQGMYPGLYKQISQQLSNEMTSIHGENGDHIPYKQRMSLSLFLGQPLDSTMTPNSIQAAQGTMQPAQQPQPQGKQKKPSNEAAKSLKKGANAYKTTSQAAEGDRSSRES